MWRGRDSAPHADALRNAILDHYGQAGPRFANALRELGRACVGYVSAVHQESLQRLAAISVHDDLVHRGAIKIALLLTTARFVPEVLGLELDVEGLWDFASGPSRHHPGKEICRNRRTSSSRSKLPAIAPASNGTHPTMPT